MIPQGRCKCSSAISLSASSFSGFPAADDIGGTRESQRKLLSESTNTPCGSTNTCGNVGGVLAAARGIPASTMAEKVK